MPTAVFVDFRLRRRALSSCFLAGGIGLGGWAANLPALARRADISEAQLGAVLLCFAAGAILAMINAPRLMRGLGAGRAAAVSAALFGVVIMLVSLVDSMLVAGAIALLGGATFGALDVTMNKEAAALEAEIARPIMSSFHALFSAGTLASALCYAALTQLGLSGAVCLMVIGGLCTAIAVSAMPAFPMVRAPETAAPPPDVRAKPKTFIPDMRVIILGGMAFMAFFAEGALLDWIAVYMVRVIGAAESMGAYSYAVFAGAMTLGRLVGDRMTVLMGGVLMFSLGSFAVALGLGVALWGSDPRIILAALALCGLGVANVIPLIFSAAGRLSQGDGGMGMSQVLTMGYAGILIGPAIIGFVAELVSLRFGLAIVAAAMFLLAFCGHLLREKH